MSAGELQFLIPKSSAHELILCLYGYLYKGSLLNLKFKLLKQQRTLCTRPYEQERSILRAIHLLTALSAVLLPACLCDLGIAGPVPNRHPARDKRSSLDYKERYEQRYYARRCRVGRLDLKSNSRFNGWPTLPKRAY